jgi:hypothetical protein
MRSLKAISVEVADDRRRRHNLVLDSTSNRPVLKTMSDDFELAL